MAENIFMAPRSAQLGLNINDIIDNMRDVDPDMSCYTVGGAASDNCSVVSSSISRNDPDMDQKKKAFVQITEQPQAKALRFRYICEGRSAGSIPGVRSTAENKTYPSIRIVGYKGPAVVVVSCVTVDPPYRPHPHNLVGKEGCSKGVCTITIDNDMMECIFSNLGIQCVKKKDVEQALRLREEIRVDPFGTGFTHRNQPQSIDLNAVRLCFQVFLSNGKNGKFTFPLKPVVSDPIYDKKATSDLNICKLSECTSCVTGRKEIILLCDKVTKEDIQIRFFEIKDGRIEWEAYGDFLASDVHKQVAISFKTPKYKTLDIQQPVNCYIQLQRPSDKATSEPRPFEYLPMDADPLLKKRRSDPYARDDISQLWDVLARNSIAAAERPSSSGQRSIKVATRNSRLMDKIKIEPPDPFLSLSPSPEGVTVKASLSSKHSAGGLVFQSPSTLGSPSPMTLAMHPPIQYIPSQGTTLVTIEMPLPQPQRQYFTVPPTMLMDPTHSSYSPQHSPYSPQHSPYSPQHSPYSPQHSPLFNSPLVAIPTSLSDMDLDVGASAAVLQEDETHYQDIDTPKPVIDSNNTLPDLGIISSGELCAADINISLSNLSASLSNSLNIVDVAPTMINNLDKKPELEKKSDQSVAVEQFTPNIQLVNMTLNVKSEDMPLSTSDSLKILTMDLENFNKLTEQS